MNEVMLKEFVAPIIIARRLGVSIEEAERIVEEVWKDD